MAGRLLVLLVVTFGLLCNTKALSLSQKNPTLVISSLSSEKSEFYDHEGRRCKMCPAGSYVSRHCETSGTESSCEPCSSDTFTKDWNAFHACVPCTVCRPLDQVTLKLCSRTSNAECTCKNGTFCSPDQPCETCHKCTLRCAVGEKMAQPCTPQSNMQCVPIPTSSPVPASSPTPPSGKNNSETHTLLGLWIFFGILAVVVIAVLMCVFRKKLRCCFRDHTTRTRANSVCSKTLLWLQTKFTHGQLESEDNERNTQVDWASQSPFDPSAPRQPDEAIPLQEKKCLIPREEERRKLVPADGKDQEEALRMSFFTIMEEVPIKKWWSYMVVLGLTDNEIEIAKENGKGNVTEQQRLMLQTWQEKNGKKASLDTLLKTLCDPNVNLKGAELKIRDTLISRHLYVYEE